MHTKEVENGLEFMLFANLTHSHIVKRDFFFHPTESLTMDDLNSLQLYLMYSNALCVTGQLVKYALRCGYYY